MCGIIGYIGKPKKIIPLLSSALEAMEYRGYDSAGIATIKSGASFVCKKTGEVSKLINSLAGENFEASIGIGHTRWATHGEPSDINAHPHVDFSGKIFVVHNGTIENFREIRKKLELEGVRHKSLTDTESIAHLIGKYYQKGPNTKESYLEAFKTALSKLEGTFALAVLNLDYPDMLLAAKRGSPALIGVSDDNVYIASDPLALSRVMVKQMIDLEDDQLAILSQGSWEIIDYLNHKTIEKQLSDIEYSEVDLGHDGYESFMEKEIC